MPMYKLLWDGYENGIPAYSESRTMFCKDDQAADELAALIQRNSSGVDDFCKTFTTELKITAVRVNEEIF
jgi:hypothetical protein